MLLGNCYSLFYFVHINFYFVKVKNNNNNKKSWINLFFRFHWILYYILLIFGTVSFFFFSFLVGYIDLLEYNSTHLIPFLNNIFSSFLELISINFFFGQLSFQNLTSFKYNYSPGTLVSQRTYYWICCWKQINNKSVEIMEL